MTKLDVFNDLLKNKMFIGIYDYMNGNEEFMFGIYAVMSSIIYSIDDVSGDKYTDLFFKNMLESQDNYRLSKKQEFQKAKIKNDLFID